MANLKKFIWDGLQSGMNVDYYTNRWPKIGEGKSEIVEALHLKFSALITILGKEYKLSAEIIMSDESPKGNCVLVLNSQRVENCPYTVNGETLIINHPDCQIRLQDNDKKWSWFHVSSPSLPISGWFGAWPSGQKMMDDESFGELK